MSFVAEEFFSFDDQLPTASSIDQVIAVDPDGLDDAQLAAHLRELTACVAQANAAHLEAVRKADRRGIARSRALRATSSWLTAETGVDPKRARLLQRRGRQLDRMPRVAEAFAFGKLTEAHVRVLAGAHTERTAVAFARDETMLVDFAVKLPWHEFTSAVRYWVLVNDPDGAEPTDQARKRFLRCRKRDDGTVRGEFCLDPVAGHAFMAAIEARSQQLFDEDWSDAKSRLDQDPTPTQLARTEPQRRADALTALVLAGGNRRGGPPLIHLVYGAELFYDQLRRLAHDHDEHTHCPASCDEERADSAEHVTPDPNDPDRRCELVDGTPVHPTVALALALTGDIRRLVLSADNEILDLGRTVRLFPQHLAAAVSAQHRGRCAHPGCDAPLHQLQIDHTIPWALHGRTATRNGRPLCIWHNRPRRRPPPAEPPSLE